MAYDIEIKIANKKSWFTPAESNAYYKARYAREGLTCHWWGGGESADKHDSIVNYFIQQGNLGNKSVNYVVSDNKITMMVNPDNVAWTSQSGNPTTISIEHQPTLSDEGYKKSGWLVNELEGRYGRTLTLYPHNHWYATSCPGTIDLGRIRAEANKWKSGAYNAPVVTGDEMIADTTQAHQAYQLLRPNGDGSADEINATAGKRTWVAFARDAANEIKQRNANIALQAQTVADQKTTIDQLNQVIAQLRQQDASDVAKVTELTTKAAALTAELETAQSQLKSLQESLPTADPTPVKVPEIKPAIASSDIPTSGSLLTRLLAFLLRKKA